jgi:hypothetical protein
MNTRFLNIAVLAGALSVFALAANAQSPVAKANVPFEFAAGGAMMPPGEYSVALLTISSGLATPSSTAKLLFERRDGMAFFSGVELPNQSVRVTSPFMRVVKGATTASLR